MNAEERQALHDAVVDACSGLDSAGWHGQAWKALDQIGVTSLSVSEAAGGAGADLRTATVVLLALGSLGASVPVVETGLMAGWLMERAGARLPGGIVTVAVGDGLQVHSDDDGWMVSGTLTRVPWARHANYAVVLGHAGVGQCVAVVPLAGAELRRGANVAGEPRDDVVLSSVVVPSADVHVLDGPELGAVDLLRRGAFGRSVLMAGAAQGVYAHTARYAGERRQFGKPLAAMQAVQQQLAELAGEASAMTVAAEAAAAAADLDPAESWPLDAARIRIGEAAGAVAAIGHQVLGAIGFTDEHPLHRLTTRLWAWREEYGNHAIWSDRLGSVLAGKDGLSLWHRIAR
jgi:acyl-CoA dehydrogenase